MKYDIWTHITVRLDTAASKIRMYINGTQRYSKEFSDISIQSATAMQIHLGNDVDLIDNRCTADNKNQGMTGWISNFYIWNRILNQEKIKAVYENRVSTTDAFVKWDEFYDLVSGVEVVIDNYPF